MLLKLLFRLLLLSTLSEGGELGFNLETAEDGLTGNKLFFTKIRLLSGPIIVDPAYLVIKLKATTI